MSIDDSKGLAHFLLLNIDWRKREGQPVWDAMVGSENVILYMNDFPDEPLYTLEWRKLRLDIEDAPSAWIIPRS